MIFESKLTKLQVPTEDVFSYIFNHRKNYDPDRVLYRTDDDPETLTLRQLEEKSRQFAYELVTRYNIQPLDVVAILASDTIAYPVTFFGILAAGATVQLIPIQAELTQLDVTSRLTQSEAKLLVTDSEHFTTAKKSTWKTNIPVVIQDCSCSQHGQLGNIGPKFSGFKLRTVSGAATYPAFINRTSGSTGNMKSVITTHAHFIAALEATLLTVPSNTDPDHDVWLSTLSLGFFINAKLHMALNILLGIPVVLTKKPFDYQSLEVVGKHNITFLFLPPPVAAGLAKERPSEDVSAANMSSLKWLLTAGAPMHEGLRLAVSAKMNDCHLTMEWATSETLLIAIQLEGRASVPGSSGTLVNGIQARVINTSTGEDLGPNEKGEILVRNEVCRYSGYKANDDANKATFDDEGWFHSGDFGFIDENCNVFITDRLKELIRVGGGYGVHVSATEIEAVIFEHPAVAQVVVTACPDPETTIDLPTAFIVLHAEYDKDRISALASIGSWAMRKLSGLQRLSGGIIFVPRFPLVGFKIDRRALKAMVKPGVTNHGQITYIDVSA